ncbi:hypothetical protein [Streptomyces chartreusis]|uniref:hypothetical protein n=1 Tax=Streptomyces chartreusis TaxID=1969 RepID=UPI00363A1144
MPRSPTLRRRHLVTGKRIVAIDGSDAGISAAVCARELDPDSKVTAVVADAYRELLQLPPG